MGRECDLELGLRPSWVSMPYLHLSPYPFASIIPSACRQQHQQHVMVFSNGQISNCDFIELQARAIIWVASQERSGNSRSAPWPNPECLTLQFLKNANSGFSMKKSLHRFLQTRKTRRTQQSYSPYNRL